MKIIFITIFLNEISPFFAYFTFFLLIKHIISLKLILLFIFVSDEEYGQKSVSVMLNGQETELEIIDHPAAEMSVSLIN